MSGRAPGLTVAPGLMGLMVISVPGCPPGPRPGSAAARLAPALAQSVTLRLVMVTRVTLGARQQRSPGQGAGGYGAQKDQRKGEDCLKNSISVTNPK